MLRDAVRDGMVQPKQSHLAHVEPRQGAAAANPTRQKRAEITRRSTPYVRCGD
jgi:deferrochelatase/peroxidase EfeB